jgi:hypothetical protein
VTAAAGVPARRWMALAATAAILAHAFGMGALGPRMAVSAAIQLAASAVAENCAHRAGAVDPSGPRGPDGAGHEHHPEKHSPSCEACPLGQGGMALAPPSAAPQSCAVARIPRRPMPAPLVLAGALAHRAPSARAPPTAAA